MDTLFDCQLILITAVTNVFILYFVIKTYPVLLFFYLLLCCLNFVVLFCR